MNYLVNIIVLWIGIYHGTVYIDRISNKNPLYFKLLLLLLVNIIQLIYEKFRNIFRKKSLDITKIIDRGIHRGALIIFGFVLFNDIKTLTNVSQTLPGLSRILDTSWGYTTFLLIPMFFAVSVKSLLRSS